MSVTMFRVRMSVVFLPVVFVIALLVSPAAGQTSSAVPRTADGRPDLRGVWNFSSATPMERPETLAGKEVLTAEEAAQFEQEIAQNRIAVDSISETAPLEARVAYEQAIWFERKNTLDGRRTSLIVDPPNGRIPPVSAEGQARIDGIQAARDRAPRGPEDRNNAERCLMGFNSGPPMEPSAYNNNVQIFQTPDHVVMLNEMVHNARFVPLDARPHLPASLRQWSGDSRARWEGDTLVVETTNFLRETALDGSSEDMHLVERFTRLDADRLLYEFTVIDPATWADSWTAQVQMTNTDEPLYEYACHEGNYSMTTALNGARALDVNASERP